MTDIQARLCDVRSQLPDDVQLVAVSKFHSCDAILEAYDAGQRIFGESRVQELQEKVQQLPHDIQWHFIGHLQVNKVKYLAPYISLIHAVDSFRLLSEIDRQCARFEQERIDNGLSPKIRVLLQLHVAQEDTKYGFTPSECKAFLDSAQWRQLAHVEIAGIMCMATQTDDEEQIAREFRVAQEFFLMARSRYFSDAPGFSECSWGMSDDYHIAVECGATLVRVGSYIFGARDYGTKATTASSVDNHAQSPLLRESAVMPGTEASVEGDADVLYQQGLAFAQQQLWGKAASAFRKALELNPASPAGESLSMIDDILAFYHKDNFNP